MFSILAAVKMLIFGPGLDEEYQLVMAYRNVKGDRLFLDMWEPHQSSAFLCSLLMQPYLKWFGTTGLVIYLRFCGTLIHLGISIFLYRLLKRMISVDHAFLLALIYFNTIPKQIMLPEFGIMQVWFFTLMLLFLLEYYDRDTRKKRYLVLAAFALVLEVLSYPSCFLLFFFLLWVVYKHSGGRRLRDLGIVSGVCVLCSVGYLMLLLQHNSFQGLLQTVSYIVRGDITHSVPLIEKLAKLWKELLLLLLLCAGIFILSDVAARFFAGKKGSREKRYQLQLIMVTAFSCIVELFYWVVLNAGYEVMQVHLAVFTILGIWYYKRLVQMSGEGVKQTNIGQINTESVNAETEKIKHQKRLLLDGMIGSGISLLAVLYLTDLGINESLPHAMLAAFFGMTLVAIWWEKQRRNFCVYTVLVLWAFTAIFGKGYSLRSATNYHNVLESGGILKYGPEAGTISNYMTSYIYNCDYEDWQNYIRDGDKVLIMADQVNNLGTIQYLFKDVEICHYSIVNPTAYDERLLEYWRLFPEKMPNVIIVDSWYGQLMTDMNGWLMQYVEKEFGYSSKTEGRYICMYRK